MTGIDEAGDRGSRPGRSRWVGLAAAALVAAIVAGTGGCGISVSGEDSTGKAAAKSGPVHGDKVQLDMRRPPTRAQLGVPSGQDSVGYDRPGDRMFDVDVQLPDGGRLHMPGTSYSVLLMPAVRGITMGNQITLSRIEKNLDAGEAALLDQAASLGFNASAIRAFAAEVRRTNLDQHGPTNRVFNGRRFGYLDRINVDFRVSPGHDEVVLNYQLGWPSEPTPTGAADG